MRFNIFKKSPLETKYEIINWLGREYDYQSYLEICTLSTGHYFNRIDQKQFQTKECINYYVKEHEAIYAKKGNAARKDHDTPIAPFHEHLERIQKMNTKFDIVFCDSFHTVEATMRDLDTALTLVSDRGTIVVHDCLPDDESLIGPYKMGAWCGQSYEGYIRWIHQNQDFENFVFDTDYGCGVIRPGVKNSHPYEQTVQLDQLCEWAYFWTNRHWLLNLQSIASFRKMYRVRGKKDRAKINQTI